MNVYEIPLIPKSHTAATTINGADCGLALNWNSEMAAWIMDVSDSAGNALISGIVLVSGVDLLGQFEHVGIGAGMATDGDATYLNLGTDVRLYFVTA